MVGLGSVVLDWEAICQQLSTVEKEAGLGNYHDLHEHTLSYLCV